MTLTLLLLKSFLSYGLNRLNVLLLVAIVLVVGEFQVFSKLEYERKQAQQAKAFLDTGDELLRRHEFRAARNQFDKVLAQKLTSRSGLIWTAAAEEFIGAELLREWRFAEAEKSLLNCYEIRRSLWGANHLVTLMAGRKLAELWLSEGRLAAAERMCRRVLAEQLRQGGCRDSEYLQSLELLSQICLAGGQQTEGEQLMQNCLAANTEKYGANSIPVGYLLELRGFNLHKKGRIVEAMQCYQAGYENALQQRVIYNLDKDPIIEHNCLVGYSNLVYELSCFPVVSGSEIDTAKAVIAGFEEADCPASYVSAMTVQARVYQSRGKFLEAHRLLDKALTSPRFSSGYSPADLYALGMCMGDLDRAQGLYANAIRGYDFALEQVALGQAINIKMFTPEERISECKSKLGDLVGARDVYEKLCSQSLYLGGSGSLMYRNHTKMLYQFYRNHDEELTAGRSVPSPFVQGTASDKLESGKNLDAVHSILGHQ